MPRSTKALVFRRNVFFMWNDNGEKPLPSFLLLVVGILVLLLITAVYFSVHGASHALMPDKLRSRFYPDMSTKQPNDFFFYEKTLSLFPAVGQFRKK